MLQENKLRRLADPFAGRERKAGGKAGSSPMVRHGTEWHHYFRIDLI
jgi:hypothetical protein